MGAGLNDLPLIHHDDHIGIHNRRKTVRYHKTGTAFSEFVERSLNVFLAFGIESAGRFVKQENRSVLQKSPGDGNTLPLASGEL